MPSSGSKSRAASLQFNTTHWSVVRDAGGDVGEEATRAAREALCQAYWNPVVALLVTRGLQRADAEDLAQDFFHRLLSGERLARVQNTGTRFRVWLRQGVENFRISDFRRRSAAKRGGGATPLSIDQHEIPAGSDSNDHGTREAHAQVFDRAWAGAVVDAALLALRERYRSEGYERTFELLAPGVIPGGSTLDGAVLSQSLGVAPPAARKALERFRRRFREELRAQVALTVDDSDLVEDELRYLGRVLVG